MKQRRLLTRIIQVSVGRRRRLLSAAAAAAVAGVALVLMMSSGAAAVALTDTADLSLSVSQSDQAHASVTITNQGPATATNVNVRYFTWGFTPSVLVTWGANWNGPSNVGTIASLPTGSSTVLTTSQASPGPSTGWTVEILSSDQADPDSTPGNGAVAGEDDYVAFVTALTSFTLKPPIEDPVPAPIPMSSLSVELNDVASGLASPVAATYAPDHENSLFVVDQTGQIWQVDVSKKKPKAPTLFADLNARLVSPLGLSGIYYDERGLLGLAFHPNFIHNGLVYTYTSQPVNGTADFSTGAFPNHQSVVTEWRVVNPKSKQLVIDPASAREIMRIDEPQTNHNGGTLIFGKDKMLYISLGDGGNRDDFGTGHVAGGNAQSLTAGNVLGKILRIDPLGRDSTNGQYGIPADNPQTGGEPEIFAYGFRNPYRMSFDRKTGALWVADVGQNDVEEIDVVTAGGNYGWRVKEGTFLFARTAQCLPRNMEIKGCVYQDSQGAPAGLTDPTAQYDHTEDGGATEVRVAVIAGYVFRGEDMARLKGRYVFGDYSTEIGEPVAGHLFYLDSNNTVQELRIAGKPAGLHLAVLGFGEDAEGNVYLLANGSGTLADPGFTVFPGTSGKVFRLSMPGR